MEGIRLGYEASPPHRNSCSSYSHLIICTADVASVRLTGRHLQVNYPSVDNARDVSYAKVHSTSFRVAMQVHQKLNRDKQQVFFAVSFAFRNVYLVE